MEVLKLGWEKEIFPKLIYNKASTSDLFHYFKDGEEMIGLAFGDPIQAKHFYEGVQRIVFQMNIQPPDVDSLQHVSGIKRKSGEVDYQIINNLSDLVDPNIRKMFTFPFKSDAEAQLCIDNIRFQTHKHSLKVIDVGPLLGFMGKRKGTENPKKRKRLSANAISSPDIDSFKLVQSIGLKQNIDNIDQLPVAARKMFTPEFR